MDEKEKSLKETQEDWDYIGNIWGWKFSFLGLFVIVALCLLMWYRWSILEVKPDNIFVPKNQITNDSLPSK